MGHFITACHVQSNSSTGSILQPSQPLLTGFRDWRQVGLVVGGGVVVAGGGACKNCSAQQDIGQDGGCITKNQPGIKARQKTVGGLLVPLRLAFFSPPALSDRSLPPQIWFLTLLPSTLLLTLAGGPCWLQLTG